MARIAAVESSNADLRADVAQLNATVNALLAALQRPAVPDVEDPPCHGCADGGFVPDANGPAPGQLSYGFGGCGSHLSVRLPAGAGVNVGPNFFVDAGGNISSPQLNDHEQRLRRCEAALDAAGGV